nr:MAG TPA: hypothetical protein [Caudoviricetes sp.]
MNRGCHSITHSSFWHSFMPRKTAINAVFHF